jgi:hypothetical protein
MTTPGPGRTTGNQQAPGHRNSGSFTGSPPGHLWNGQREPDPHLNLRGIAATVHRSPRRKMPPEQFEPEADHLRPAGLSVESIQRSTSATRLPNYRRNTMEVIPSGCDWAAVPQLGISRPGCRVVPGLPGRPGVLDRSTWRSASLSSRPLHGALRVLPTPPASCARYSAAWRGPPRCQSRAGWPKGREAPWLFRLSR